MKTALAIFVKTPGLSPVKTRLASAIGADQAVRFYRMAAAATAAVSGTMRRSVAPYWAVAEREALSHPIWQGFDTLWQHDGDLGLRLHHVYATLQERHGRVLLIGADAPQLTAYLLWQAVTALDQDGVAFTLGPAADGGFWLVGGNRPVPQSVWTGVRYSERRTGLELHRQLLRWGAIANLPPLTDVDTAADLPLLRTALGELRAPLPEQCALQDWLNQIAQPLFFHKTGAS